MRIPARSHSPVRSIFRRTALSAGTLVFAAIVAVGCGGGDGGGASGDPGASGIVGDEGPLAWLPRDTWLVASANLDADAIDDAVTTLDRLPVWSLAEGFLPASDGPGLRRELLEEIAKSSTQGDGKPRVTAKQLEAAFGDRLGVAIIDNDFEQMDSDQPPVALWIEVDDEDAAVTLLRAATKGKDAERSHEGVDYLSAKGEGDDSFNYLVQDGLAIVSPSAEGLETLIETHEGDRSLADDETARAVIEAGVGSALGGLAVQSGPLLDAVPDALRRAAKEADDPADREDAEKIAREIGPLLEDESIDGLVADWTSASLTVDDSGLRIRGAWSNPRELADPAPGSRELVERAPATTNMVSAYAASGDELGRIQDAWKDVREAYDLDLRKLVGDECKPDQQWACNLGIEFALTALEDEDLADVSSEAGDVAVLMTQDFSSLFSQAFDQAVARPLGEAPPAISTPTSRFLEYAVPTESIEDAPDWKPGPELEAAMRSAGLVVTHSRDKRSTTVKVTPGSPMARAIRAAGPDLAPALAIYGIDLAQLTTTGVTFSGTDVDDLTVFGLPQEATSPLSAALRDGGEALGDDEQYGRVTDAAKVPKRVGQYSYTDLAGLAEQVLTAVGETTPDARRVIPTVRNNLADVPGIVSWTARDEVDGERVGTWDVAIPILE